MIYLTAEVLSDGEASSWGRWWGTFLDIRAFLMRRIDILEGIIKMKNLILMNGDESSGVLNSPRERERETLMSFKDILNILDLMVFKTSKQSCKFIWPLKGLHRIHMLR